MQLILVRHPQPQVAAGTCYGSTDLAVDAEELARVRDRLVAQLPPGAPLFSSPLLRCADLARSLPTASLTLDARLVELDFGAWEMRAWDDIARAEVDAWAADVVHYRPGGGENLLAAARRVAAFYAHLRDLALPCAVVICHAGTIRLLLARQRGLPPVEMARQAAATPHQIGYGEVITLALV